MALTKVDAHKSQFFFWSYDRRERERERHTQRKKTAGERKKKKLTFFFVAICSFRNYKTLYVLFSSKFNTYFSFQEGKEQKKKKYCTCKKYPPEVNEE